MEKQHWDTLDKINNRHCVIYQSNANYNFAGSTSTDTQWNEKIKLNGITVNGSTATRFTINKTGFYSVNFEILIDDGSFSTSYNFQGSIVVLNSAQTAIVREYKGNRWIGNGSNNFPSLSASHLVFLEKDQVLAIKVSTNYPNSWSSYASNINFNTLSIIEL